MAHFFESGLGGVHTALEKNTEVSLGLCTTDQNRDSFFLSRGSKKKIERIAAYTRNGHLRVSPATI